MAVKGFLKGVTEDLNTKIVVYAEVIAFFSVLTLFFSLVITSLSLYSVIVGFPAAFWIPMGILIAYLSGIVTGYCWFAMYNFRITREGRKVRIKKRD